MISVCLDPVRSRDGAFCRQDVPKLSRQYSCSSSQLQDLERLELKNSPSQVVCKIDKYTRPQMAIVVFRDGTRKMCGLFAQFTDLARPVGVPVQV